jgi:kumamolisin
VFAQKYGLRIASENLAGRSIHLEGTPQQMSNAFGVCLGEFQNEQGEQYLSHEGAITVPESLARIVMAVLGLDQHPAAQHHAEN